MKKPSAGRKTPSGRRKSQSPDSPAPFEALRLYIDESVDQILREMQDQQISYAVPSDDVLALIRAVAQAQGGISPWRTLESWALRHAIPLHQMIQNGPVFPLDVMRKRLRDLLGYVVLGLVLTETTTGLDSGHN